MNTTRSLLIPLSVCYDNMALQHEILTAYLNRVSGLSFTATYDVTKHFRRVRLPKNALLTQQGEVCSELYFIVNGSCRCYHIKKRKQFTHWFAFEESFLTGFQSFTSRQPNREYLQLMEDSSLLRISHSDLMRLYAQHPEWQTMGRLIVEDYSRRLMNRVTTFQTLDATQRYIQLFKTEPRILQRVPVVHIASYLGVAPDTLSRIRSQIL